MSKRVSYTAILLALSTIATLWAHRQFKSQIGPRAQTARVQEALSSQTTIVKGSVVGVSDGDTITVLDEEQVRHKIRLMGIDAPEKSQPFGKVSKQVLSDLIFEKRVDVRVKTQDQYGRWVGKVFLNGVDINLEQIKAGLAWHYKHYASDQFPGDAEIYADAEREARAANIGLWAYVDPQPPWEWRRSQRKKKGARDPQE